VLLIGCDAADWEHINPLLEEGLLPTLAPSPTAGPWITLPHSNQFCRRSSGIRSRRQLQRIAEENPTGTCGERLQRGPPRFSQI